MGASPASGLPSADAAARTFFGRSWRAEKRRQAAALQTELLWLDDAQSSYLSKVPFVERGYLASALQSRCADNEVIEADHFAGSLQFRPNARMFISGLLGVRDNRHRLQDGPQITFTRGPVLSGRPLYSVPELGNGDRRNLKLVIGTGSHPLLQVESALLPARSEEHTSELQ